MSDYSYQNVLSKNQSSSFYTDIDSKKLALDSLNDTRNKLFNEIATPNLDQEDAEKIFGPDS